MKRCSGWYVSTAPYGGWSEEAHIIFRQRSIVWQLSRNAAIAAILKCPVRVKETEVAKVRAVQRISYPEAVRRVEEETNVEETMVFGLETPVNVPCQQDPDMLHVEKVDFVLFIALGIN
jgi:hypothetical protein